MKANHVLSEGAPVACTQLRIVRFSYVDFEGHIHHDGEIMVMAAVADHVQTIFETLYQRRFPITKARLIDHYRGDDAAAMREWGGYWDAPIDYQHFQVSRKIAERMAGLPVGAARDFFKEYVKSYRSCLAANRVEKARSTKKSCLEAVTP